jgi:hypothetical protein
MKAQNRKQKKKHNEALEKALDRMGKDDKRKEHERKKLETKKRRKSEW